MSRKLEKCLETRVPEVVRSKKLMTKVNQEPEAIITSDTYWISRLDPPPPLTHGDMSRIEWSVEWSDRVLPKPVLPKPAENIRAVTKKLVSSAVAEDYTELRDKISKAKQANIAGVEQFVESVEGIVTPFGPDHFETQCGIKVRGTRIIDYSAHGADYELLGSGGEILRVNLLDRPAASVILRFDGDFGTVLPVIRGFVTAVTVIGEELVDVAYEPSVNTNRWNEYANRATEIRWLRAVAAVATQQSRFRIEKADAMGIAKKMQYAKSLDPSLALYAAYAYHDLQDIERIREMSNYLRADIGVTLFDIALLSRVLTGKTISSSLGVVPFVPLLAQGWSLLGANQVRLHPALNGIERTMLDSVWSLFNSTGLDMLQRALQTGDVQ